MKLYLDTEFNGHGGELISMALVSAPPLAHEWYGGLDPVALQAPIEPWVKEHVIPVISGGGIHCFHKASLREVFHAWISKFTNPEIICDWHADAAHFCAMLEGPDFGTSLDFPCTITILKTPPGQPISAVPHNALEDARALMRWDRERKVNSCVRE